jgi:hypothetical protein
MLWFFITLIFLALVSPYTLQRTLRRGQINWEEPAEEDKERIDARAGDTIALAVNASFTLTDLFGVTIKRKVRVIYVLKNDCLIGLEEKRDIAERGMQKFFTRFLGPFNPWPRVKLN